MPSSPHPSDPNYDAEMERQGKVPKKKKRPIKPAPQKPATHK